MRALADVVAYLDAVPQTALMDATEIRVRRPTDRRAGRHQFISGKARQNSVKALLVTDARPVAVLRLRYGLRQCLPTSPRPAPGVPGVVAPATGCW